MNLSNIIYKEDLKFNPDLLKREHFVQRHYEEVLFHLAEELIPPHKVILQEFFRNPNQKLSIAKNQFPYDLSLLKPSLMEHWILWSKEPLEDNQVTSFLDQWCEKKDVYAIWENADSLKSVKELYHYHFILKGESQLASSI